MYIIMYNYISQLVISKILISIQNEYKFFSLGFMFTVIVLIEWLLPKRYMLLCFVFCLCVSICFISVFAHV
jgi:hypothetical protein